MILFGYPILVYDKVLGEQERKRVHQECIAIEEADPKPKAVWDCDVYTTCWDSDMQDNPKFKYPLDIFTEKTKHFLAVHGIEEESPVLDGAWFNSYTKDQFQDQHTHFNTHISAVYFLSAPEGSSPLKFHNPVPSNFQIAMTFKNDHLRPLKYIDAVDDRLVVFLSSTPHSVPQGFNKNPRYSIAINYGITNKNNYKATQLPS